VFHLERETVDVYEDGARRTPSEAEELAGAAAPGFSVVVGELFDAVLRPERRKHGEP
jgi:hypothetical protein